MTVCHCKLQLRTESFQEESSGLKMLELIPGMRPVSHILCKPTDRSRYVVHLSAHSSKRIEPHKTAAEVTPANV